MGPPFFGYFLLPQKKVTPGWDLGQVKARKARNEVRRETCGNLLLKMEK
jgi:hypothetical protein